MMDDGWFEIIIPDHPLPPALAPRPVPQGKNEQDGEQVRLLERAPAHYLAVAGEFFGRGVLFPTFNAGIPDLERFSQTFPCHCSLFALITKKVMGFIGRGGTCGNAFIQNGR
jgi:hypothetical protein